MSLKLSLRPGETFIVNCAVVRNGDRRGVLLLENQARILREKDLLWPQDVETPAERVYFAIMQMYLTGCLKGRYYEQFTEALTYLVNQGSTADERQIALEISADVTCDSLYRALGRCRKLMLEESATEGKAA